MSATTTKDVLDEFARVLGTDKKQGRVTLIASATEVKDDGDDIVEAGAFRETLMKRKPKIILGHDWKQKVAKVVSIREYMPGDPELKRLLDRAEHKVLGWPEEAGALVAEVQFNFDTQRGRDAFADVLFYEDEGEWSIGYKTRESYRKKGVRHITRLDLYEVSYVLHGMNRWSKTLSIKDVFGGSAPASTDLGFGQTASLPRIGVRKRDKGWSLVRTETDTDLRMFDTEDEAYEALRRMSKKGDAFLPSERMRMAEAKIALPDGSMPIIHRDDLLTAIAVADQMQDLAARQHVLDRATVMGAKSLVDFTLEVKRDYSKAEREEFADKGWALDDGSFPIADREDLKNAVALAHLGSDPAKAWAHILKRAEALGAMDVIPDEKKAAPLSNTTNAVTDDRTVLVDDIGEFVSCGCEDCPGKCSCDDCPKKAEAMAGEAKEEVVDDVEEKAGGADRNRGNAEVLRKYWSRGRGAAKIRWGVKNDFYRCVALVSKHMTTTRAKGYCANRHKDATGFWPGKGPHSEKSADGVDLPEHLVVPSITDYSSEDMDAIIETAKGMDPDEHPPEVEMDEISLGAKGMDSDMVAAMAVNAFRDLSTDPSEEDIESVRSGIKTLAEALGEDHELHLDAGLFPEENAAFAAQSVKSVRGDTPVEDLDAVRQAIHLLSDALETALYGEEFKHAGPWTEEYQPGKHTGPHKPGFKPKGKKRKPKKPGVNAPSIKPKKSKPKKTKPKASAPASKPKTKPKASPPKKTSTFVPNGEYDRDKINKRPAGDLKEGDMVLSGAGLRAVDSLEPQEDGRLRLTLAAKPGSDSKPIRLVDGDTEVNALMPEGPDVDAPDTDVDAPDTDVDAGTGRVEIDDIPTMSADDSLDYLFDNLDDEEVLDSLDMDYEDLPRDLPEKFRGLWDKAESDPKLAGALTSLYGDRPGDDDDLGTPEAQDYARVQSLARDAGMDMLADSVDPEMNIDTEAFQQDIDNLRENAKDDPGVLAAMNRVFGDPAAQMSSDEDGRDALRRAAETAPDADDTLRDRPSFGEGRYENYTETLGSEEATAFVANMPLPYRKAAERYTGEKYRPINRALRKGDSLSPPEENEVIAARLDEVFEEVPPTTKQGTVYRGLSGSGAFVDSLEPGAIVEDEGFSSTSTDEDVVRKFFAGNLSGDEEFDEYGVMLNVTVPAGSKVLPMASVSDFDVEQEILLPRGAKYRVTGKKQNPAGGYIVDVELVME